jgi:SEC-C motif domain protein
MASQSGKRACPCGKPDFSTCCGRFLSGTQIAENAEQLMRSRYSAFSLRDEAYLRSTWHPDTLPDEPITAESDVKWIALDVIRHTHVKDSDDATVEFVARFKVGGRAHRLHEISNFVRQPDATGQSRWYYVDGNFPDDE